MGDDDQQKPIVGWSLILPVLIRKRHIFFLTDLKSRTSSVHGTFGLWSMMDTSMVRDCATLSAAARSFGNHCSTPPFRTTSYRCAVAVDVGAGTECHSVSEAICPAGNCGHVRYARQ